MISVAIMAHPKREQFIPYLLDRLDATPTVVWDEREDIWDTGRRSLLAYDPEARDHLVVQDDALLCRDLVATCARMREQARRPHPIGLYFGSIRPIKRETARLHRLAVRQGKRWIMMRRSPLWGVALLLPTEHIEQIVAFGDDRPERNYDRRIARWYWRQRIPQMFPVPSPVDHRSGEGHDSMVPGRANRRRIAHSFIGEDRSGLDIDWRTKVVR